MGRLQLEHRDRNPVQSVGQEDYGSGVCMHVSVFIHEYEYCFIACVYVHACSYVCAVHFRMHCIFLYTYLHLDIFLYIWVNVYCVCIYIYCLCMGKYWYVIHTYVCLYLYEYIRIRQYISICKHTHKSIGCAYMCLICA